MNNDGLRDVDSAELWKRRSSFTAAFSAADSRLPVGRVIGTSALRPHAHKTSARRHRNITAGKIDWHRNQACCAFGPTRCGFVSLGKRETLRATGLTAGSGAAPRSGVCYQSVAC